MNRWSQRIAARSYRAGSTFARNSHHSDRVDIDRDKYEHDHNNDDNYEGCDELLRPKQPSPDNRAIELVRDRPPQLVADRFE